MTPRAGGEADKFGNSYEGAWTTWQILEIVASRADSIQIEPFGGLGEGVEFALLRNGLTEVHQVKRQPGSLANWTLRRLEAEGVLASAAHHIDRGRVFRFVSAVPARDLMELTERARRSDDLKAFTDGQLDGDRLRDAFAYLTEVWDRGEMAFGRLRSTYITTADEYTVRASNEALASALLTGAAAPAVVASLGDLSSRNVALTLDADAILIAAAEYGLAAATELGTPAATLGVAAATDRWLAAVASELLDPEIERDEALSISERFEGDARLILVAGTAGAGKTGVLHQVATAAIAREWAVLALRLDRVDAVASASELGRAFDLPGSPVSGLAAVAGERDCLLIIDQLDAVSFASGRVPTSFDAVAEVVRQARAFPQMRVLLAARRFDVDNDARIRGLIVDTPEHALLDVGDLDDDQVAAAVEAMGLDAAALATVQKALLRSPLNLTLLNAITEQGQAPAFEKTRELMDLFWERKRRECREHASDVRFELVIERLVDEMSSRQRLAVPAAVLDRDGLQTDADALKSSYVLVADGTQVAFFHEAFFDYSFARAWSARGEPLLKFLLGSAQELFRRGQVRQVLLHLRDDDPGRFRREVEDLLLDPRVRFHIKDVVIAILRALADPSPEDWALVERLLQAGLPFEGRLWQAFRTERWFGCLDDAGVIQRWLASDSADHQSRAVDIMVSAADSEPDRIARLLKPHVGGDKFPRWFVWMATWLPFSDQRPLFDLLVDSVRRGEWNEHGDHLGLVTHKLGEEHPDWACELLAAWLKDRPDALSADGDRIASLETMEYGLLELGKHASSATSEFVDRLLGYMLDVMRLTEHESERLPARDAHFAYRVWRGDRYRLGDVLLHGMSTALAELASSDPGAAEPHLRRLAADPHDGAQWLLYEALRAAAPAFTDWCAELLLQGEHRLYAGYTCDSYWTTRQLLEAFGPHFSETDFARIEQVLLGLAPDWETPPGGYAQFTLLSALPHDRMSDVARRRLGELRRRFDCDAPSEPEGIKVGWVGPPVPQEATPHLSDDDWLRIAAKYGGEREDFTTFRGGAQEQSNVLAQETEKNPERFARLGLRLSTEHNPVYLAAILRGLGQTGESFDPELACAVVRHGASLEQPGLDRWIPSALGKVLSDPLPTDVIEIVLDRALRAQDPEKDLWLDEAASGQSYYGGDPFHAGMNSARGGSALTLGDLLVHDSDGSHTEIVAPRVDELASDPRVSVRTCVVHVIHASMRHSPAVALAALQVLIDSDDRLLAADPVERLIASVGFRDVDLVRPVVGRMLNSEWAGVREAGGRLAAFFGLELEASDLLEAAATSPDENVRAGLALVCAQRLPYATDAERARALLLSCSRMTRRLCARPLPASRRRCEIETSSLIATCSAV